MIPFHSCNRGDRYYRVFDSILFVRSFCGIRAQVIKMSANQHLVMFLPLEEEQSLGLAKNKGLYCRNFFPKLQ
ncbi:unnamed protein product [Victoria cruziana]